MTNKEIKKLKRAIEHRKQQQLAMMRTTELRHALTKDDNSAIKTRRNAQ